MKFFIFLSISILISVCTFSQKLQNFNGKWEVKSVQTDRVFRDFKKDSTYFYLEEDRKKVQSNPKLAADMLEVFDMFSGMYIEFKNNFTFIMVILTLTEEGTFQELIEESVLLLKYKSGTTEKLKILNDTIVLDMSDDYDARVITLFKKINRDLLQLMGNIIKT